MLLNQGVISLHAVHSASAMKLGGYIVHLLLVPIFVLCWVPPLTASVLLVRNGQYAAQTSQMAIAVACGQLSNVGDALGILGVVEHEKAFWFRHLPRLLFPDSNHC